MGRIARALLIPAGIAAVLAISLASCGGSNAPATKSSGAGAAGSSTTAAAPSHGVAVTPGSGHPTTTFSLRFIAPALTRTEPRSRIGFAVSLLTPAATSCIGTRSLQAPAAKEGDPVSVTLDPARLGGTWCTGVHRVRVIETESPVCHAGTMCPEFVRVIRTVGTATFRVTP
jgi:hypothetical protein